MGGRRETSIRKGDGENKLWREEKCKDRNKRKSRENSGTQIGEEGLRGKKGEPISEGMMQPYTLD